MANLNLQTASSILGKTTTVSLSGTTLTSLLSNASSSGFVYKVRSIVVANATSSAANITIAYYSAAALGGTAYPIVSTLSIPAYSSFPVLDSNTFIYLKDDSSIGVTAGTGSALTVTCAYEQVTADAIPSPASIYLPIVPAGTMWTMGWNIYGNLGLNLPPTNSSYRSSPTQVGALSTWIGNTNGGIANSSSIRSDGTLWMWGANARGQLGQNNLIDRSSPVQVGALTNWSQISSGGQIAAAIKNDGTLWTWGINTNGGLGQNDLVSRSSPVQVGALTNWGRVCANDDNSVAVKTDGTLWVLGGSNSYGQLGQNDRVNRSSPTQIGSGTNWYMASSSSLCTAATKSDGTLWTWGKGNYGKLAQGDTVHRSSPTQVGTLADWSVAGITNFNFIATKTDGTLWTCGDNYYGQLGINSRVAKSSPVQVGALTTWSKKTALAQEDAFAIKTNGTLWTWGKNSCGMSGTNNLYRRSSPVQVGALTTWVSVCASGFAAMVTKT